MARMMKFGRTTPLTTDPNTGARIANPEKMGGRISGDGFDKEVSSWPVVREAYKSGKYGARKFTGTEFKYDPRVENYLKGKTDILSEDIDEPTISRRTNPLTGENVVDLYERYKPGGPTYNKIISRIEADRRPKKGEIKDFSTTQYESALSKSGVSSGGWGVATGPNYVESFTPGAKKTQTIVKAKTPNTVAPKIISTNIKKVAVTTPKPVVSTTPTTKSKSTVAATPKEDMTPPSRMAIKKPGLIKTEKRELQGELEQSPEYTSSTPIASRPTIKYNKGRDLGVTVGTSNAKMFGIGRNEVTPLGAKIVQKLTGYSKTDELEKDESGRVIFQGASGFKELKAQKKYNKEFDKYQAKQDQQKAYSSMMNNPANRNTINSQLEKLKK